MNGPGGLRRTSWLVAVLALLASLSMPTAGRAQGIFGGSGAGPPAEAQAPSSPQDSVGTDPQAIRFSDVPLKAGEHLAVLQAIETQLSSDPDIESIEDELPDELASVARSHERLGEIVLEHVSLRELWNLTGLWQAYEDRLSGWTNAVDDELRELAGVAERGAPIREQWRLTAETLAEDDVGGAVVEQADRVLAKLDTLLTMYRDRLDHLVGVKSGLEEGLAGVRHVLEQIEDARASVRGRVLTRTAPPVWDGSAWTGAAESERAARIWAGERDAVASFTANNSGKLLFGVLIFLVFVLLAIRLRNRIGTELDPADESMKGTAETLRRPVSAAFLLAVLAGNALLPRATPFVVWQLLSLAVVVPLYRLLPRSSNPVVNRAGRSLLVLFAVVQTADVLVPPTVEYRLLSLLAAAALAGVSGWLLRGADREQMQQTGWGALVWRGLQVSLAVGATSVVTNVLGWTLLAETLLTGVLLSAYLGLAVIIAYRLVAGVIRLLPRTRIGRQSRVLRDHGDLVTSRAITLLKVVAIATWTFLALQAFQVLDPLGDRIQATLTDPIEIGAIQFSLERVLSFALAILLTIWIARFVSFLLDVEVLPRLRLKRGVSNAISTVVQWAILGIGLVTAAGTLGLEAGQLAIVFGALGVGIGFGLQNIVSNFVSGLILIFEQPVKVGDKVEITSLALIGEVRRIGIRASVVRTFDGAEVIVPNANLVSSEVVNWTLSDQKRRVRVEVGVAYGTELQHVISTLKKVAAEHPEVLKYPEPQVVFLEFGDSALLFRLMFWTASFDAFFRIRSEVTLAVNDAFKEAGILIPFPQRDLHVKSLPESASAKDPAPEV